MTQTDSSKMALFPRVEGGLFRKIPRPERFSSATARLCQVATGGNLWPHWVYLSVNLSLTVTSFLAVMRLTNFLRIPSLREVSHNIRTTPNCLAPCPILRLWQLFDYSVFALLQACVCFPLVPLLSPRTRSILRLTKHLASA